MSFWHFIRSKVFFKHSALAIGLTLLILFIIIKGLSIYTGHGNFILVPNLIGQSIKDIEGKEQFKDFQIVIIDSIHDPKKIKGSVVNQDPIPNAKVKKGRTLYLTIVSEVPEFILMPNLVDLTERQAINTMEVMGLKLENVEYIPNEFKNVVLGQKFKGSYIKPETRIEKGSGIVLVMSSGSNDAKVNIPLLIGKKQSEVRRILESLGLKMGEEIFRDGNDTSHAKVLKQSPAFNKGAILNVGQAIDLWYGSDKKTNFKELLDEYLKQFDEP